MEDITVQNRELVANGAIEYAEHVYRGLKGFVKEGVELACTITGNSDGSVVEITNMNEETGEGDPHETVLEENGNEFTFTFNGETLRVESTMTDWSTVNYNEHTGESVLCIVDARIYPD